MAKKYDVIALGELLIDFTMNGQSEQGTQSRRIHAGVQYPTLCAGRKGRLFAGVADQ